jgi:ketosteroid isomerase-like protein
LVQPQPGPRVVPAADAAGHPHAETARHQHSMKRHHRPMNSEAARRFVKEWVAAWNAHDLEAILAHFTDDAVFASPVAARLIPGSDGVVRSKEALREYWREGLRLIPDLRFEVLGHYVGVGVLVINYRTQNGGLVNEVLLVGPDGLATGGYGTYLEG